MRKIKIAQIGTSKNSHGNPIFNTLKKLPHVFEIVGYAFPENEREKFPKQVSAFADYREMTVEEILNDKEIEAVAVETEEIYLTKYALMCAKVGKHIHMEKPGGLDDDLFQELINTVKEKNLKFHTGYMYRYNPIIREVLKNVKEGKYGEIQSVEAQMSCWHSEDVRRWLKVFPGGMLYFLGCHLIDLIYQIQGEPEEIIPLSASTGFDAIDSIDQGMVALRYKNGISFAKTSAVERGGFERRQLVITGSEGTAEINPLEVGNPDAQTTKLREYFSKAWRFESIFNECEPNDRFEGMMMGFARIVAGEMENPYTPDYELKLHKLITKCCK